MQHSDYEYQPFAPQPNNHIVKFSWLGEAWAIYRQGWKPWLVLNLVIGAPLLITVVGLALSIYLGSASDSSSGSDSGSSSGSDSSAAFDVSMGLFLGGMALAVFVLGLIVSCCSSGIASRQARKELVRPADIFAGMDRWIPVFLLSLILMPALLFSSVLLGVGLFAGCGLLMPAYAFAAGGESAAGAFSKSVAVMKSDWIRASLFCLLYAAIAVIGTVITLGFGLLVFVPMMHILSALACRDSTIANSPAPKDYLSGPAHGVWPPAPTAPAQPQNQQDSPPQPGVFPPPSFNQEAPWRTPGQGS